MIKHSNYYFVCSNRDENIGEIIGRIFIGKKKRKMSHEALRNEDFYVSETEVPINEIERYHVFTVESFMMKKAA